MSDAPSFRDPDDLPALYQSANKASLDAQRQFLRWTKGRFVALLVAAVFGAVSWELHGASVAAWFALVAFLGALLCELVLASQRPERSWYEGRAAAESAKTLSWRYMTCAEAFEPGKQDVDKTFVAELNDVLHDLGELSLGSSTGAQITEAMRQVRALPFEARRRTYKVSRIENQRAWYANKAKWNEARARWWTISSFTIEFLGVIGAILKITGTIDFDALGICAAAAATAVAWVQAKQYQTLATAYGVTSQELASVASELEALSDENQWPKFVAEAEEAISREHTLWRASRGIRIRPAR